MIAKKHIFGFTFIELIISVTILSILSMLGFIAYTNQSSTARDAKRTAEITEIDDALKTFSLKAKKVPLPQNAIQITLTGAVQSETSTGLISYQGEFGTELLKQIGVSQGGVDPKDKFPYVYTVNKSRRSWQLLAYLESNPISLQIIPEAYAGLSDYSSRFFKVIGKPVGIITENATKKSIHEIFTASGYFNILTTGSLYTLHLSDSNKLTGTTTNFIDALPNKSCKRIRDIGEGATDGIYKINPFGTGEIEVFCDMTRDQGGWTLVFKNDGDSDTGALLNNRNTGAGYNTTFITKSTFSTQPSFSGSTTLSDSIIATLYTEQFRIEGPSIGRVYGRFTMLYGGYYINVVGTYNPTVDMQKLFDYTYKSNGSYSAYTLGNTVGSFQGFRATNLNVNAFKNIVFVR